MGDSHAGSGHAMAVALEATLAGHLDSSASAAVPVTGCQLREYASGGYFFNTLATNPFDLEPALLRFNSTCEPTASQPLGGMRVEVFETGGYAEMRSPLLPVSTTPPCFLDFAHLDDSSWTKCVDTAQASLAPLTSIHQPLTSTGRTPQYQPQF